MMQSQIVIPLPAPAFERVADVKIVDRRGPMILLGVSVGEHYVTSWCEDDDGDHVDAALHELAEALRAKLTKTSTT